MIWAHDALATRHSDPLQRLGIQKKREREFAAPRTCSPCHGEGNEERGRLDSNAKSEQGKHQSKRDALHSGWVGGGGVLGRRRGQLMQMASLNSASLPAVLAGLHQPEKKNPPPARPRHCSSLRRRRRVAPSSSLFCITASLSFMLAAFFPPIGRLA